MLPTVVVRAVREAEVDATDQKVRCDSKEAREVEKGVNGNR